MPNPAQALNNLHFKIQTGDDDVRADSEVYGTVVLLQGQQVNTFSKSLNDKAGWQGGSTHESDITLPDVQVKDIQGLRIVFASGNCFLCTQDNWNMDGITVTYKLDDGNDDILVEQAGRPLMRFTGSAPEWSTSFNW